MSVGVSGHSVVVVQAGNRNPEKPTLANPGNSQSSSLSLDGAVFQDAERLLLFALFFLMPGLLVMLVLGEPRNGVVVGLPLEPAQMPRPLPESAIQLEGPRQLIRHRPSQAHDAPGERFVWKLTGNAPVDDVHNPPHGTTSIEESGRATNDFDALRGHGFQSHCMVRPLVGHIPTPHSSFQDPDPVAPQAPDDGSARARPIVGRGHPRCFCQGLAQARLGIPDQVPARQSGGRLIRFGPDGRQGSGAHRPVRPIEKVDRVRGGW